MGVKPEIGKEYIEPNEEQHTQELIDLIIKNLQKTYHPGKTLRQFHAKMHGFVEAVFTVNNDLPQHLQYGFLQPGRSYKTWIRFSNGNTKPLHDRKPDLRGMAIKILNVEGEILVQDEKMPQSQDILLVSYPTLMSHNIAAFRAPIRAICGGKLSLLFFALNPFNWPTLMRTLRSMQKMDNPLVHQYWSMAPSRLGTATQAVKYSAVPATTPVITNIDKTDRDYLRKVMQEELNSHDFSFHFMIQLQDDAVSMPIEDPTVEWKSPFIKVATITIPKQIFNSAERNTMGENASYSPWHSLEAHQPLGGINRARKKVYAAVAAWRLKENKKL
ncbi:MAG: catalase family protein [Ferruginibacter sp.]